MKIYPVISGLFTQKYKNNDNNTLKEPGNYVSTLQELPKFAYMPYFGERVDKGLERFYETNKDFMPITVRKYIESLSDKSSMTPMEAVNEAFEDLENADTIQDIKKIGDPLFKELIDPNQSKATRGIINSINENEELLNLYGQTVLQGGENFTVYIVKKVFLENKTIEEINKDLEQDLNPDLKQDFKSKNPDSPYVLSSTLKALGIKPPRAEYRASLRYTRDGYSDLMGEKISEAQRILWELMPPQERTARARRSVEKFEIWWNSISYSEKLDMIAKQQTELELLKSFKKSLPKRSQESSAKESSSDGIPQKQHTSVGSNKLSQDDLFKIWASNNLKLFEANLSEADKDTIHIRKMALMVQRWANMTNEERTDYISKMQSGLEPLKFTMIDAWNHCPDIIRDLSAHLKENQIYNPLDLIYSSKEFSTLQSQIMKEFWDNHPEHAQKLGEEIINSQNKVKASIENGTFKALQDKIYRERSDRKKMIQWEESKRKMAQINAAKESTPEPISKPDEGNLVSAVPQQKPVAGDYMSEFKSAYLSATHDLVKNLPPRYINEYFEIIRDNFDKSEVISWTKNLRHEQLSDVDLENIKHIKNTEPKDAGRINRALEGALANVLYECTRNPLMYRLSYSDLKVVLSHVDKGDASCTIFSHKLNKQFDIDIVKNKFEKSRISKLYNLYSEPLDDDEMDDIITTYFDKRSGEPLNQEDLDSIAEYLDDYGKSLALVFSLKSTLPADAKAHMLNKILFNMPDDLYQNYNCIIASQDGITNEELIKASIKKMNDRFYFVPVEYMREVYNKEFAYYVRRYLNPEDTAKILHSAFNKRTNAKEQVRLSIMPKHTYSLESKLKTLAMEQALGDVLYEITDNPNVYTLSVEEMFDFIELYLLVKKFPCPPRVYTSQNGVKVVTVAKNKPNMKKVSALYHSYYKHIQERCSQNFEPHELLSAIVGSDKSPKSTATLMRIQMMLNKPYHS